ncbi:unnamed protein product [Cylindrotheca closterium]|uniref:Fucokinase n=1 Tax=Cylindrotheca closterium TaxID=2856 RepID=A0AAD2CDW4_9STRA|nr:unnamed protein product [Cylindrotheca closterium]
MTRSFPFDCVVVTSPDAASAESSNGAVEFLKRYLKETYEQEIRIVSTFDPFGARCGSGGGTIAALEYASPDESILVLHAGGDSSRCPTQMILGKAWTNLPHPKYRNPTIWLVDQLVDLCSVAQFPKGTMVVAATDCLLKFFDSGGKLPTCNAEYSANTVIGVAVPALLTTAKNHGVYIMSEPTGEISSDQALRIENPLAVWQKPSIEKLVSTEDPANASFEDSFGDRRAWIDTGLVIFLPGAAARLFKLADTGLSRCTRKGLETMYKGEQSKSSQSLEVFAKANALKVDLYTDILHNLSWPGQGAKKDNSTNPFEEMFSDLPLRILLAPKGAFLHLGTSSELLSFMTHSVYPELQSRSDLPSDLGHFSFFQSSFQCLDCPKQTKSVALHSTFPPSTSIGTGSLVEYCDLAKYVAVTIGDNCILSGWKDLGEGESSLMIPSNICVQQLTPNAETGDSNETVFMVYGTNDSIKSPREDSTLYGVPVDDFQQLSGNLLDELGWPSGTGMWTARIHPRVRAGTSFEAVFGWLKDIRDSKQSFLQNESFQLWRQSPRVSLKELHGISDANAEWAFRRNLELAVLRRQQADFIPSLQKALTQRSHDEVCDVQWLYELGEDEAEKELSRLLEALEDSFLSEIEVENYDICGRSLMLASVLVSEFLTSRKKVLVKKEADQDQIGPSVARTIMAPSSVQKDPKSHSKQALCTLKEERRNCESAFNLLFLEEYSEILEMIALKMNEMCVCQVSDSASEELVRRREGPSFGVWVIASSPVRIDIAGGWSDTPPICYEYGGSVTGMAVLVDDHMPLSCRCRIVPEKSGLLLRSESRELGTGSLSSAIEVEVSDIQHLGDFRDPRADCALLKAALIVLNLAKEADIESGARIQDLLDKFCSSTESTRLEVVTTSLLPQGSGMGTSSILAGCILGAVAKCVGIGDLDENQVVNAVLMAEQLLSSGGGWQDQANGLVPGIKTLRSRANELPVSVSIEKLPVDTNSLSILEKRLVLVFTGKTRLAKGILQKVLRRWARRESDVLDTVKGLVECSEHARSLLLEGRVDELGGILTTYAELKVKMAGEDAGVEPDVVKKLVQHLTEKAAITGHALCGAGGGGFLAMLASPSFDKNSIQSLVETELSPQAERALFTWHSCKISDTGMKVSILRPKDISASDFDLTWHRL